MSGGQFDPNGIDPHQPGAKLDGGKPRLALALMSFPRALSAVAGVGEYGARKYSLHGWRQVPAGQERYTEAMLRHTVADLGGEQTDQESGHAHAAHAAWNALARLELELMERENQA